MHFTDRQLQNFFAKVLKTASCWLWTGTKINNGYGRVNLNGRTYLAHRISYLIHKGDIPKGVGYHGTEVLHACDVRACVNPDHLSLGTQKDNVRDAMGKGRKNYTEIARRTNHKRWGTPLHL